MSVSVKLYFTVSATIPASRTGDLATVAPNDGTSLQVSITEYPFSGPPVLLTDPYLVSVIPGVSSVGSFTDGTPVDVEIGPIPYSGTAADLTGGQDRIYDVAVPSLPGASEDINETTVTVHNCRMEIITTDIVTATIGAPVVAFS